MTLIVHQAGLWTTVQDRGRTGWQRYGVPVGGPMDLASYSAANTLVGNGEEAATLELTLSGGVFEAAADLAVAVCGADLAPTVDGVPLPMWRPVVVPAGATLRFGAARVGRFAYLAVAGGFRTPIALGSRATAPRGGLPGADVRRVAAGDVLKAAATRRSDAVVESVPWFLGEAWRFSAPDLSGERVVRATRGPEWESFDEETKRAVESGEWTCVIRAESDRMGYRLRASSPPTSTNAGGMLSSAATFGTVQAPPDGHPIALMADRQTTGGYPRLLQVAAVDLGRLAQARPGDVVRFRLIEQGEAVAALIERAKGFRWLRERLSRTESARIR
jgi:antagonist of KipI